MQTSAIAKEDRATGVTPPIVCDQPTDVAGVTPLPGFRLLVRFNDGVEGEVDLSRRVRAPNAGVFAPLADPQTFAQVGVQFGAVWWPGDIDLAPDAMHAELKAHGVWRLG